MTHSSPRLLIVGYSQDAHIGARLLQAAHNIGLKVQLHDADHVFDVPWVIRQFNWRIRGHRPPNLNRFSQVLVDTCQSFHPNIILVTGTVPVNASALMAIKSNGTRCINYLTDDPWSRYLRASWLFQALPNYDIVFSPRRANLGDLRRIGCRAEYLPFGYDPMIHYSDPPPLERRDEFACDVLFYGGGDRDRVPYMTALAEHGIKLHLYGGYWNRYPRLQPMHKGFADPQTLRWAVAGAKVNLCLVRRANRDGHVMRSFEVPAMQGCLLTEDTAEHREIFGRDGEAVVYFEDITDMLEKLKNLLADAEKRQVLAENAFNLVCDSANTYLDRLTSMLERTNSLVE